MTAHHSMRLAGRSVVVTGGGRGIGRAIAEHAAGAGAGVVVVDVRAELHTGRPGDDDCAEQAAAAIRAGGGAAVACVADAASLDGAQQAVELARERFGGLDAIVCCAGNLVHGEVHETTEREWDGTIRVHLRGHWCCTRAAATAMVPQGRGRLVYISSPSALIGPPFHAAYATAKAGIFGLLTSSARALQPHGISVNCVVPGAATRMTDALWRQTDLARHAEGVPGLDVPSAGAAGTWRDPANVATFVLWLLADAAPDVTAQAFAVVGHQVTQIHLPAFGRTIRSDGPWDPAELADRMAAELRPLEPPPLTSWPPR